MVPVFSVVMSLFLTAGSSASDPVRKETRFIYKLPVVKRHYAYPAVTVESSVWTESYTGAPAPRSMPTAITVQASAWASSFAPPPAQYARASATASEEPAPEPPAPHRMHKIQPAPTPAAAPEAAVKVHPKHVPVPEPVVVERKPKSRPRPIVREREESDHKEIIENKNMVPPAVEK